MPCRGLRRDEAARYIGVCPRKFDELVKDGRMPKPGRINGIVVWDVRQLDLAFDDIVRHDQAVNPNPWDS